MNAKSTKLSKPRIIITTLAVFLTAAALLFLASCGSGNTVYEPITVEMEGMPMKEYILKEYTTLTENGYAKLNGTGASLEVRGIDGGDGGETKLTLVFSSEPGYVTQFEIEVNGEKQVEFKHNGGSGWFNMAKETFSISLEAGNENVIKIITPNGRVTHLSKLIVGDYSQNDYFLKRASVDPSTYSFSAAKNVDFESSGGVKYAKLDVGDSVTLKNIDGGKGGLTCGYVRSTTQPGVMTTLSIKVNDNRAVTVEVAGISDSWFQCFDTGFETYLKSGKKNTVTVQVVSGGITHFDLLVLGKADGLRDNPYSSSPGRVIGNTKTAKLSSAGEFLKKQGLITDMKLSEANILGVLGRITADRERAAEIYSSLLNNGELTGRSFAGMLLASMGYDVTDEAAVMKKAQSVGVIKNVAAGSFGDTPLDFETFAALTYNCLNARCVDGTAVYEKCGIKPALPDVYDVAFFSQNSESSFNGSTVKAVSSGGISGVSTVNRYGRFILTCDVTCNDTDKFAMGFRVGTAAQSIYDSGVWLTVSGNIMELSAEGQTVRMEMPLGLFHPERTQKIKVTDNGEAICVFTIEGDSEAPLCEIRFQDGYAVGCVRGHVIHGIKPGNIANAGHISFSANSGTVTYANIVITAEDPYQNLTSGYPQAGDGGTFRLTEDFEDGFFDYNAFFATGSGVSTSGGKLVFSEGNESLISTTSRIDNGVFEAFVESYGGSLRFELAASSPTSKGTYYDGLSFDLNGKSVKLHHGIGNEDAEANTDELTRSLGIDTASGFYVRLTDTDRAIYFDVKERPGDDYTNVISIDKKGGEYLSVLKKDKSGEEAHYDKLARDFGFIRIASSGDNIIDCVSLIGNAYLPYEELPIEKAPAPDKDEVLEADDVESLIGVGYIPYFGRYKTGGRSSERPSVEEMLPDILSALKLKGSERAAALDKIKWGYAWWAEPLQGMYCGRDYDACRTNLSMIAEAGIDFIYIDNTNFNGGCSPDYIIHNIENILEAALELKAEGKAYPRICFWNNVRNEKRGGYEDTARETWQLFVMDPRYKDLWVYYHGKPLMLYTFGQPMPFVGMDEVAEIREMWITSNVNNTWSFHQDPDEMDDRGGLDASGHLEQINVLPYGKTTFRGNISELPELLANGSGGRDGGLYYRKYWEKAFEKRPKFVTLWAYNHWDVQFNKPASDGTVYWGDNFCQQYSGGLEPIKGNFSYQGVEYPGDSYYEWTGKYIEAYKNHEKMPEDLIAK